MATKNGVNVHVPYVPLQRGRQQPASFAAPSGPPPKQQQQQEPKRPSLARHITHPAPHTAQSPTRHHRRAASGPRKIKETLNASATQSDQGRMINQYLIKGEIGRGSFGAVHLAMDASDGKCYAIKEFSKARLRKRTQSAIMRRPAGSGVPRARELTPEERENPLFLIRGEVAIMKKLNHENVVNLVEVLDDPHGDSLYLVLDLCEEGVIMKVGMDDKATPYSEEECRHWFRDLILGMEYLHEQGIVHRDVKPDNLLLNKEKVLKIVDFGVSEIFSKENDNLQKSAGSPAFSAPELCSAQHGDISGKAADIWSMGVTLYCLYFGCLPFSDAYVIDLYNSIRTSDPFLPSDINPDLRNLFVRILEKDPAKRIKMYDLREHPWVTVQGDDTLLSAQENTSDRIGPLTDYDLHSAIKGVRGIITVMKAVHKLKNLTLKRRANSSGQPPVPSLAEFLARQESVTSISDDSASETSSTGPSRRGSSNELDPPIEEAQEEGGKREEKKASSHGFGKRLGGAFKHYKRIQKEDEPMSYAWTQMKRWSKEPEIAHVIAQVRELAGEDTDPKADKTLDRMTERNHALESQDRQRADEERSRYEGTKERRKTEQHVVAGELEQGERKEEEMETHEAALPTKTKPEFLDVGIGEDDGQEISQSPAPTDEEVFEKAFRMASDTIRQEQGPDAQIFGTWKEELRAGKEISNAHGREKLEMPLEEGKRTRWERALDKFEGSRQFAGAASEQIAAALRDKDKEEPEGRGTKALWEVLRQRARV